MKKIQSLRTTLVFMAVLSFCFVSGCNNPLSRWETSDSPPAHSKTIKPWSLMMYIAADVEPAVSEYLLGEIQDIIKNGSTPLLHVVVQVEFPNKDIDTKRYYVSKGKLHKMGTISKDMLGTPEAVEDFLKWGLSWKAEHHALVMMGHGTGWITTDGTLPALKDKDSSRSFGYSHSNGTAVTVRDFSKLLNKTLGGKQLDIAVFNSCLMSGVEIAFAMSDYFDYLIAAETNMPAFGLDYGFIIDRMGREVMSPEEAALHIHTSAESEYLSIVMPENKNGQFNGASAAVSARQILARKMDYSVSCLNLTYVPELTLAVRDFCHAWELQLGRDYYSAIDNMHMAIKESRKFGELFAPIYQQFAITPEYKSEYVDLNDLMSFNYEFTKDKEVLRTARVAMEALDNCIMASWSAQEGAPPSSMSVFIPASRDFYRRFLRQTYLNLEWPVASSWGSTLDILNPPD